MSLGYNVFEFIEKDLGLVLKDKFKSLRQKAIIDPEAGIIDLKYNVGEI